MFAFMSNFSKTVKNIRWRSYSTKLSYIHNPGDLPLQYMTTGKLLEKAEAKFGDRIAIISKHQNKSLSFSEVLTQADKLAAGLTLIGLQKKDRVGVWAPNLIEWYISKLACARAGLITVCLNPFYQPAEVEFCMNKVQMKALICANKLRDCDCYENLLKVVPEVEKSEPGKLSSNRVPTLKSVISISDDVKPGTYNYNEIIDLASSTEIPKIQNLQNSISPDDASIIQFTSGTTGTPKAALLSHFGNINIGHIFGNRSELHKKHHTVCMQLPLFHVFGTVGGIIMGLHCGTTMVLPTDVYSPEKSLDAIKNEKCTAIFGVPTMFLDLIELQEKRKEEISVEMVAVGGAFSSPEFFKKVLKVLNVKKIFSVYGMTETCGAIFQSKIEENEEKSLTNLGTVYDTLEVKVVDKNGYMVPFGTAGELCVRGFCNMINYWDDTKETKKVLDESGWLKTGDQFILEEDGVGMIVGRIKEMIIRGGENIVPKEIEEHLLTHSDIVEAYVIGIPHDRLGEEVCACIKLKTNSLITHQDIHNFCKEKLAYFKIPSRIEIMDAFPRTSSGKIQKFKLMEIVIARNNCAVIND